MEKHYIAVAIEEWDYQKLKSDLQSSIEAEKKAEKELKNNKEEISDLEKRHQI